MAGTVPALSDVFWKGIPACTEALNECGASSTPAARPDPEGVNELSTTTFPAPVQTFIDDAEKRVWFLYEASRQGDPTGH